MSENNNPIWQDIATFLIDSLGKTRGDDLRRAVRTIEAIGSSASGAVATLCEILRDTSLIGFWEDVADALGAIGPFATGEAVIALADLVRGRKDVDHPCLEYFQWGFQRAATVALARIDSVESISELTVNEQHSDVELNKWIRSVLKRKTERPKQKSPGFRGSWNLDKRFTGTGHFCDVIEGLMNIMMSGYFVQKLRACMCLEAIGPDGARSVPFLVNVCNQLPEDVQLCGLFVNIRHGKTSRRLHAMRAVSRIFGLPGRHVPKLVDQLSMETQLLSCRAAKSLGQIGWKMDEAVPVLIDALTDQDRRVRWLASQTLLRMGPPKEAEVALDKYWKR